MLLVTRRHGVRGLGDPPSVSPSVETARIIANAVRAQGLMLHMAPASTPEPTQTSAQILDAGPSADAAARCDCAVSAITHQYNMDAASQSAALAECLRDTGSFFQNARAMGVPNLECADQQPWYKRPAVLIGGGAAVIGLVLIGSWALK